MKWYAKSILDAIFLYAVVLIRAWAPPQYPPLHLLHRSEDVLLPF